MSFLSFLKEESLERMGKVSLEISIRFRGGELISWIEQLRIFTTFAQLTRFCRGSTFD